MAKWYIKRNDKQAGPFESAQLKQLAADAKIKPDDLVRREDQEAWHKAESVKGLFLAQKQPQVVPAEAAQQANGPQSSDPATQQNSDLPSNNMQSQQSAGDWYRIENGQSVGPVPFKEFCEQYKAGIFGANDFIAQAGMRKWTQAGVFLEQEVIESATSEDEWFIIGNDQNQGPYAFSYLQGFFANNELAETDLIGRKGSKGLPANVLLERKTLGFLEWLIALGGSTEKNKASVAGGFAMLMFWLLGGSVFTILTGGILVFTLVGLVLTRNSLPFAHQGKVAVGLTGGILILLIGTWSKQDDNPANSEFRQLVSKLSRSLKPIPKNDHETLIDALGSRKPELIVQALKAIPDKKHLFTDEELAAVMLSRKIRHIALSESGRLITNAELKNITIERLITAGYSRDQSVVFVPRNLTDEFEGNFLYRAEDPKQNENTVRFTLKKSIRFSKKGELYKVIFHSGGYYFETGFNSEPFALDKEGDKPCWIVDCYYDNGGHTLTAEDARLMNAYNGAFKSALESRGNSHSFTSADTSHKAGDRVSGIMKQFNLVYHVKTGAFEVKR